MSSSRFDVLVLGGGTAGCVLAARLSEESSRTICLVEAGPDYGSFEGGGWPEDMLDGRQLAFSHSWETDREDRSQLRARILGGCSAHNACVVLEERAGRLRRLGRRVDLRRDRAVSSAGRAAVADASPVDRGDLSRHAAFAEAAGEDATILNPLNAVGRVRWNAAFAYLDPARERPNLAIMADTLVDRVLLDGNRATGAERRQAIESPSWSSWPRARTGRRRSCCAAASGRRAASRWART